jgi:hypothetical protein
MFLALTVISGPALAQTATPTTPPLISPGPSDEINPDANITWPPPVYVVRGSVDVRGSANLPNMTNYFIEYRELGADMAEPPDTQPWFPVSLPTSNSVSDDVLASWDTTTADDGVYELRLTVNLASGEPIQETVRPIRVENNPPPFVATTVAPTVEAPTAAPTIPPPPTIAPQPTVAPTLDNSPRATVNVPNGNVRSGDTTAYSVILTVSNGTVLPIVGISTTGSNWLLVDLPNGGRGWIAPSIVQISGNTSALPRIAPPPPPITNTPTPPPFTATPLPSATPATAANLVAGIIRLSANPPQCKTTFTVNVDMANLGTQDTTNSGTFLIQDIADGNEIARAYGPVPPIKSGQTVKSADIPITVSSKHNDTHTIRITLNVENTIPETNTGDDVNSITYRLGGDCG